MPTPLPREPSGGSGLHQAIKQIKRILKEMRIISTPQYSVDHFPDGQALRFPKVKAAEGGGGGMNYRGNWSTTVHYKEDDVVMVRNGLGGPESQGTFICIREHDSDSTNYPREATQEGVDPGTGGTDDMWRTLAAGAWDELDIRAFPVQVEGGPDIVLAPYTHLAAGSVGCFGVAAGGVAGLDYLNGTASGSKGGSGTWELSAQDLPLGEIVKFRMVNLCIGGEKHTAWIPMSEPKPVP